MDLEQGLDAAVVGGGIAGMVSGVRLAELGARVAVLEKGSGRYPCNVRMTGGAFHVAFRDVMEDPAVLLDAMETRTRGYAQPQLARALAADIGNAVRWLKTRGVRFIKVGHEVHRQHTLAPPILLKGRNYWEGRGGDVLLRTLAQELEKLGGRFVTGARARALRMRDGRCVGVDVERGAERISLDARAVVLCDGGFQANLDLLHEYVSPAPEKLKQRGAGSGMGDALLMAREAGAKLVGMDRIYGHVLSHDAMHNDDLSPFPIIDFICAAGVVVDASGRRFLDEGLGGVYITNRIAALADPLSALVVFDEAIWNGPGREFISPANPLLVSGGATMVQARDLAALAQRIGMPQEALVQSVRQYNDAVASGTTARLDPPRSAERYKPHPIQQPPFYALRLCAGLTYTMGGIAIDADARVLNGRDQPIAGLYAAGCATGGLEGGEFAGYVGGLTKSTAFAFRAANDIARTLAESRAH
ncbi:MAG: FAD-dependent oxidoreductase [Burkholderiales bacterium]|nr:FAD-dependent oxidoreductase [Burkholderiales bacterium]